jgi:type II restriction enzyme
MNQWNFEVPVDKSSREFDFAISNGSKLILMEVNFYGSKGGSKLKATAGEFKELFDFLKEKSPKTDFVWITDGKGWHTARLPLQSAFERVDYVWNLAWLSRGYLEDLI